jgi:hypothetical protein
MNNAVEKSRRTLGEVYQLAFLSALKEAGDKPFLKCINWFTGVGKTHSAALFSLELLLQHRIIPVFLAPLQSLVTGFADEIRKHQTSNKLADDIADVLLTRGSPVPVYRLYSVDYHMNNVRFFESTLLLLDWLEQHTLVRESLREDHEKGPRNNKKKSFDGLMADVRSKANYCKTSNFLHMSPFADDYDIQRELYRRAARAVVGIATRITRKAIMLEIASRERGPTPHRLLEAPVVSEMVKLLFPLQAFLDRPGIIVSTASKFSTAQEVFIVSDKKVGVVSVPYENVFHFIHEINQEDSPVGSIIFPGHRSVRTITFIDEEEDSYWFLFEQHKSVVNPEGRNDLNEVISEFVKYFDLVWPSSFEKGTNWTLAKKVYYYLGDIAAISSGVWSDFDAERAATSADYLPDVRRLQILRAAFEAYKKDVADLFTDAELREILTELLDNNDSETGFERFKEKARVLSQLREFIKEIPRREKDDDYITFRRVRDLIFDKKYFEMSRVSFGEMLDQPGQTFFNQSANIMVTDFFKHTELLNNTGNQTVRLHYHENDVPATAFTLLHYMKFVLFIARIMDKRGSDQIRMPRIDIDDRYINLDKFRKDVHILFKARNTLDGLNDEINDDELITDEFIYSGTKSVVTLDEAWRQAEEYNYAKNICLTASVTSLRDTPEQDIRYLLARNNGIFLMSATGGLQGTSSGAFNMAHLKKCVEDAEGCFFPMSDIELTVARKRAHEWLDKRERRVQVVDFGFRAHHFPTSEGYSGLSTQFADALLQAAGSFTNINVHKEREIEGLVCSLDRLLTTNLRSGLCLCISVAWMRRCLRKLAEKWSFVKQMDATGHHFVIQPQGLPYYRKQGAHEDIVIILYQSERFRLISQTETGVAPNEDDPGQFSQELYDALKTKDHKVLLWTAYGSAGRGVNFVVDYTDKIQDFELVYLINAPFYTRHTRPSSRGFSMESLQSLVQTLRDKNGQPLAMTRADLLYEFSRNRWKIMEVEHIIDVVRTLFQALGRVERRPNERIDFQEIYVDADVAKYIYLGAKFSPGLRERASPSQISVLRQIDVHNEQTALFQLDVERRDHEANSLALASEFARYTSILPSKFRSSEQARINWGKLFDLKMFSNPVAYMKLLQRHKIPEEVIRTFFLQVPAASLLYTKEAQSLGWSARIITDYKDGRDLYHWASSLGPSSLLQQLDKFRTINRHARGFAVKENPGYILVPQPWFVRDIMKGYLAEIVFEDFVRERFGFDAANGVHPRPVTFIDPVGHPLESEIYQLYDYYLQTSNDVIVAVDIKNWTRATDQLKKEELEISARKKHKQLRHLFPRKTIHAIYINLHGAHKYRVISPSSGSIRFMSLYVKSGTKPDSLWIPNTNLMDAILAR